MRLALLMVAIFITVFVGALYSKGKGFLDVSEFMPDGINLISSGKNLPNKGKAPELVGLGEWINSEPLTLQELKGKVILVDFWTYSCINCIRTFPHITSWYEKYKDSGFVILGIHSPEFEFEKKKENVVREAEKHNLTYPIAQDNDHATWRAFKNRYWPAHYLIDTEGNIRYTHFGEGKYAETESAIQQLLLEANLLTIDKIADVSEPASGVDFRKIGTPEIYLGYLRINNFGSAGSDVKPGIPYLFTNPKKVENSRFYLSGNWKIDKEFSELVEGQGKIIIRYKANKLNVVLDVSGESAIPIELLLDGEYLTEQNKGSDVVIENAKAVTIVESARLYNLVDMQGEYEWHTLEIIVTKSGFKAFAFTFG